MIPIRLEAIAKGQYSTWTLFTVGRGGGVGRKAGKLSVADQAEGYLSKSLHGLEAKTQKCKEETKGNGLQPNSLSSS